MQCVFGLQLFASEFEDVLTSTSLSKSRVSVKRLHGSISRQGNNFRWTGKTGCRAKASAFLSLSEYLCYTKHYTLMRSMLEICKGHINQERRYWSKQWRTHRLCTQKTRQNMDFHPSFPTSWILWIIFLVPTIFGLRVPLLEEGEEKVLRNGSTRASWNVGLFISICYCVLRDQLFYLPFPTGSNCCILWTSLAPNMATPPAPGCNTLLRADCPRQQMYAFENT